MYTIITGPTRIQFDTFNQAWAYAKQQGGPFEMRFSPANRKKV